MLLIAWLRPISPFVRKHFMDSVDLMPHSHTSLVAFWTLLIPFVHTEHPSQSLQGHYSTELRTCSHRWPDDSLLLTKQITPPSPPPLSERAKALMGRCVAWDTPALPSSRAVFCWHMRNYKFSTEILDITVIPSAASYQSFFRIIFVSLGWHFTFPIVELFQVLLKPICSRSRLWNSTGKCKQTSQLPYLVDRQQNMNYKLYLITRFVCLRRP